MAQNAKISAYDRDLAKEMLQMVESDIKKQYYDPKFHGMNVDVRFAEAERKIDSAGSLDIALTILAVAVADLNDPHTMFLPPPRAFIHDYGLRVQFIGDKALITAVRPGSDAEKKSIKPGDQVLAINGMDLQRDDYWKFEYIFWVLRPQPSLHLRLRTPSGELKEIDAQAYMRPTKLVTNLDNSLDYYQVIRNAQRDAEINASHYEDLGDTVLIKLTDFDWDPDRTGIFLSKARSRSSAVIALRGNPGGAIKSMEYFTGGFFDHEVKIADRVGRKQMKPSIAKPFGRAYQGNVVILLDSESGSCAEMFARVMQLEKRAIVVGDRSSGSAMEAHTITHKVGSNYFTPFALSLTDADLVMSDGKSLEHVGVTPDVVKLPTVEDLAAGRDPVLAYAAELVGAHLTPEEAGKMFPVRWPAK